MVRRTGEVTRAGRFRVAQEVDDDLVGGFDQLDARVEGPATTGSERTVAADTAPVPARR